MCGCGWCPIWSSTPTTGWDRKRDRKKWLTSPQDVARTVFLAANASQPQARYLCGRDAWLLLLAHALLPTGLYDMAARWVLKKLS